MRKKPPQFEALYSLPVWAEILLKPNPGETVDQSLVRLTRRTNKYRHDGRFYRLKIESSGVRIQRVPEGGQKKLSDWMMMPAGSRLLLKTNPNDKDLRSAKETADYLSGLFPNNKRAGHWRARLDERGRLIAERYLDANGELIKYPLEADAPMLNLWAGEWP